MKKKKLKKGKKKFLGEVVGLVEGEEEFTLRSLQKIWA
jgi:hypothetical protein